MLASYNLANNMSIAATREPHLSEYIHVTRCGFYMGGYASVHVSQPLITTQVTIHLDRNSPFWAWKWHQIHVFFRLRSFNYLKSQFSNVISTIFIDTAKACRPKAWKLARLRQLQHRCRPISPLQPRFIFRQPSVVQDWLSKHYMHSIA